MSGCCARRRAGLAAVAVGAMAAIAAAPSPAQATGCAQGAAVRQIEILGGGHQYPGATPPDLGP